jgi:hypothetical protein
LSSSLLLLFSVICAFLLGSFGYVHGQWAGAAVAGAISLIVTFWVTLSGRSCKVRAWMRALCVWGLFLAIFFILPPRSDRDWAPDVARGVTSRVEGSQVQLTNVRNFRWITRDVADERWTGATVDLDQLQTVDLVMTTWGSPHIAHTMLSFGFADGQYVVLSAEIRREADEAFSELGGFFKQFELVLVAATEDDIVRLRTHARADQVSLYRLEMTPEQRRQLFLSYLELGNDLDRKPRWYQTITTNCTTVIWRLARLVAPGIPLDWRVLLSGHVPDYLYDIGVISNDRPLEEVKRTAPITAKAQALPNDADFSQGIRAGDSG